MGKTDDRGGVMSDLMDNAVISMPYELAMSDEISRKQFYSRAQEILKERDEALAKLAAMESQKPAAYGLKGMATQKWDGDTLISKCDAEAYDDDALVPLYAEPVSAKPAVAVPSDAVEMLRKMADHLMAYSAPSSQLAAERGALADEARKIIDEHESAPSRSQQSAWNEKELRDLVESCREYCFKHDSLSSAFLKWLDIEGCNLAAELNSDRCPSHESEQGGAV